MTDERRLVRYREAEIGLWQEGGGWSAFVVDHHPNTAWWKGEDMGHVAHGLPYREALAEAKCLVDEMREHPGRFA